MPAELVELPADEPPKDGTWVDFCDSDELSPEEIEAGEALREAIDPDDDEDNGGVQ